MTLCSLRKARELTQKELARTLGVSQAAIASYEVGERVPSRKVAARIRDYFGLSTEEMWNVLYASCDNEAS